MANRRIIILLGILLIPVGRLWASEIIGDTIKAPRPKVGIVLGGGGAKGAAHIGVLKYIDELGIPVDYVVGTSMGSIIGGLYALGYPPDEIEDLISNLDWGQYMNNTVNRDDISSAEKQRRSTYLVTIPFNNGQLVEKIKDFEPDQEDTDKRTLISTLPDSFIGGADLLNLFNSLCIGYQDSMDFNDLPIRFACVATDIAKGKPVVLRSGKVPEAIRASMSIPGVFSPIVIDGNLLVDGGLTNNFPADVCREMGADIVIGVEVAQGMITDPKKLKALPQLAAQLKNMLVEGNNAQNRQLCDLYIHPQVGDYGMMSFNAEAIDTIVHRGYRYAERVHDELLTIKRYVDNYEPTTKILQAPRAYNMFSDTLHLKSVSMDNVNGKEFNWLLRKSKLKLGTDVTSNDIQRAINVFKGTGSFSSIEYHISPILQPAGDTLREDFDFHLKFQTAEPHSIALGLNYNSEESASIILNLGIGQNKFSGWKGSLNARIGLNTRISGTVTWAGLSLANFNARYSFSHVRYNMLHEEGQTKVMKYYRHHFQFYISEFHLRSIQVSAGLEAEHYLYPQNPINFTNDELWPSQRLRENAWGPFVQFRFDNMDDAYFATRGMKADAGIRYRLTKDLGPVTDINLAVKYHLSAGRFSFIPQLYVRWLNDFPNLYAHNNIIGGDVYGRYYEHQLPFIGVNSTMLGEEFVAVARLDLRYRFYSKHYLTLMGNVMRSVHNAGELLDLDEAGDDYYGFGLRYSYNSPIGPISFDVHYSDITSRWGSYFTLGYVF
ncbi:MAG: patatin-like phospholipase family protein [Bacteroidales bacterium]|nr:patatin-like phospholipase family protein [Bacteroidales bacterium]